MKTPITLLLTSDNQLEELVTEALSQFGFISHVTHDADDAMATISSLDDLDTVIVDFEHGPQGMTLLRAIRALRENTPVVVITSNDEEHVEALAYANGATVCMSKHVVPSQLASTARQLCDSKPKQVFA